MITTTRKELETIIRTLSAEQKQLAIRVFRHTPTPNLQDVVHRGTFGGRFNGGGRGYIELIRLELLQRGEGEGNV